MLRMAGSSPVSFGLMAGLRDSLSVYRQIAMAAARYSLPEGDDMSADLRHFAINATDVKRARRFYESIFGWTFEAWGPPDFLMINTGGEGAVEGSLQRRRPIAPGLEILGCECTFAVDDVKAAAARIEANGGQILMQPTVLTGVGELIFFRDTEGNVAGAMRYDSTIE